MKPRKEIQRIVDGYNNANNIKVKYYQPLSKARANTVQIDTNATYHLMQLGMGENIEIGTKQTSTIPSFSLSNKMTFLFVMPSILGSNNGGEIIGYSNDEDFIIKYEEMLIELKRIIQMFDCLFNLTGYTITMIDEASYDNNYIGYQLTFNYNND